MTTSKTIERIEDNKKTVENSLKDLEALRDIKAKLEAWNGNIINKKFFETHYLISNEYRSWTKHEITTGKDYFNGGLRLYVSSTMRYVVLESRGKADVIKAVEHEIEQQTELVRRTEENIKVLSEVDEDAIIAELIAIWEKYGRPKTWATILDEFEVKYPNI